MEEIWRTIPNLENYQVSNLGRIIGPKGYRKLVDNSKGYLTFRHRQDGKNKTFYIHRMVAKAFLDSPIDLLKSEVNHIDYNRFNNIPSNLEWITRQDNMIHKNNRHK